ncbi:LysM peptidoglycan-binding domain-containing protein [Cellulomonas sp. Root485]|uniref:LysM peptidoglycan-binding domain-containing protein n=1 Tax=Cellulomonas sp. Root485 TaxID=1736546 RepID=UPI0012FAE137|nr:LysM domain-containing protein [Cellulomonas sp. Root485]
MRRTGASIGGLLAGTLASATLAGVLALHVRAVLSDHVGPWQVDTVIELAVAGVGSLVAAWLAAGALLATVCVVVRAAGASWRAGERLVHRCAPQVVRKALVLAVGAGIGLGMATGASAAVPEPSATVAAVEAGDDVVPSDLGWTVTTSASPTAAPTAAAAAAETSPDPTTPPPPGPTAAPVTDAAVVALTAAAPPATAPPTPVTTADAVVVAAGDSLWSIAARHLPPDATDAEVAAAWPRWYEANSAVIGADPGLIQPGQVLMVPAPAEEPAL